MLATRMLAAGATAGIPTHTYNYGFRIEKAETNPDTRVTYLADASGKDPASMNFGTGVFDYGGWEDFCNDINRPVMLKYDGTVDYELYATDQTKKLDGVTASDVATTAYGGNAMSEFKQLWIRQYQDADYEYIYISDGRVSQEYYPWAHMWYDSVTDNKSITAFANVGGGKTLVTSATHGLTTDNYIIITGTDDYNGIWQVNVKDVNSYIIDRAYTATDTGTGCRVYLRDYSYRAMYEGTYVAPRLRSLATGTPMNNVAGATEISRALANGDNGHYINYRGQHNLITYLLWLISKSTNDQGKFGNGVSDHSAFINAGTLVASGQFKGFSTTTQSVKVFYVENLWGNYWQRQAGLLMNSSGVLLTKLCPPYTITTDTSSAGHISTGITRAGTSGDALAKADLQSEHGLIPKETGGTTSQNYCCGFWFTNPTSGQFRYDLVSGDRTVAGRCGAGTVYLDIVLSYASPYAGAALSFLEKPS